MVMSAGNLKFIVKHFLKPHIPHAHEKHVMFIARMLINWNKHELAEFLQDEQIDYDQDIFATLKDEYNSKQLCTMLGFQYSDIELCNSEYSHDFNKPLPDQLKYKYDLVIECGTLEHIFDIKMGLINISQLVKIGGELCHISPIDSINHGYYNLSLNMFDDFYNINGFEKPDYHIMHGKRGGYLDGKRQTSLLTHQEYVAQELVMDIPPEYQKEGFCLSCVTCTTKRLEILDRVNIPMVQRIFRGGADTEEARTSHEFIS